MKRWWNIVLVGYLLMLLGACGNSYNAPASIDNEIAEMASVKADSFVGQIPGSEIFVAVVKRGAEVEAYICDGTTNGVKVAVWLEGKANGNDLSATSGDGKVGLEGSINGSHLNVQISGLNGVNGQQVTPLAAVGLNTANHPAGLWKSFGGLDKFVEKLIEIEGVYTVGWIVLPDGRQRGAALKDGGPSTTELVNPENTGIDTEGGFPVNSEPMPANPPDPGLCAVYQGAYVGSKTRLTYETDPAIRKKHKEIMRNALMMWNAECKGTYGDINNLFNGL